MILGYGFHGPKTQLFQILLEGYLVLGNIDLKVWLPGPLLFSPGWRDLPQPLPAGEPEEDPPEITSVSEETRNYPR